MRKATVLGLAVFLALTATQANGHAYPGAEEGSAVTVVSTVSQRPEQVADNTSQEQKILEDLLREHSPIRVDAVTVEISDDWAFADVAERDAKTGKWVRSATALLQRGAKGWKILTWGRFREWDRYAAKMPPKVRKAFERWKASHL